MPSFQDSAVIFFLALLLFGPKKLPELARQLGKLMGEFRRASNEFRMQMEDELRLSEQEEKQKKIAAMEAAAPVAPILAGESNTIAAPVAEAPAAPELIEDPLDSHPHTARPNRYTAADLSEPLSELPAPIPIATSGDLSLMPPATGLPLARSASTSGSSALGPVFDAIPPTEEDNASLNGAVHASATDEAVTHG